MQLALLCGAEMNVHVVEQLRLAAVSAQKRAAAVLIAYDNARIVGHGDISAIESAVIATAAAARMAYERWETARKSAESVAGPTPNERALGLSLRPLFAPPGDADELF